MSTPYEIRGLAGWAYLETATELLLAIRSEELHAGALEAADIQWWWREGGVDDPAGQQFWFDRDGQVVAALLRYRDESVWACDAFWRPSAINGVREHVWPAMLEKLAALPSDLEAEITAHEHDIAWAQALESIGWRDSGSGLTQMFTSPQEFNQRLADSHPVALPSGYAFATAARYGDDGVHHLASRNGPEIFDRLRECSLYRSEFDLHVRSRDGEVAAYCLGWLDHRNRIGLLEPVRTEERFQRQGFGRAVVGECLQRLQQAGATCFKVSYRVGNDAADRLYHSLGFRPVFRKCRFVRERTSG